MHSVNITLGDKPQIIIDGVDFTDIVTSFDIEQSAGECAYIILSLIPQKITIHGNAFVNFDTCENCINKEKASMYDESK
jgi:hypothetical protein